MLTQPPKQCLICWYLASAGQLIITVGRGPSQTVVSGSQVTCDWEIIDNWKIQAQTLCFGLHVLKMQQKLPNAANLENTAIWAQGNIWQMGPICQQNVLSMDYFLRLRQTSNIPCDFFWHHLGIKSPVKDSMFGGYERHTSNLEISVSLYIGIVKIFRGWKLAIIFGNDWN